MTYKPKIGIIGVGFVGGAVAQGFSLHADVKMYDRFKSGFDPLHVTVNESDFLFVCVPTPTIDEGQDLTIIRGALDSITSMARKPKVIIIKSTILPGTTRQFSRAYPSHHFITNPEFLTERNARLDFINSSRIIIGWDSYESNILANVIRMYRARFSHTPIYTMSWEGAELTKYMSNGFFAMKVSFMNEMFNLAKHFGVPWKGLVDVFLADGRIGNSHVDVPGHDGKYGYGGTCFPKDVKALIRLAQEIDRSVLTLEAADKVNDKVR